MGFHFRKRVRLFKGAWISLSKQGGYLSIGAHGLTTDVRPCSLQNEGTSATYPACLGTDSDHFLYRHLGHLKPRTANGQPLCATNKIMSREEFSYIIFLHWRRQ
jgi:hypothetical protein